ncbi:MAG: hypothetical protein R3282_00325, partial [Rhodothermales bacterium]|nr:hypothetical protein [Rhodothermales bacterium]
AGGKLTAVAFSGDGRLLAASTDRCVVAWFIRIDSPDASASSRSSIVKSDSNQTQSVLASLSRVNQGSSEACVETGRRITTLGVDDDGQQVVVGESDGEIAIWTVSHDWLRPTGSFKAHNGAVQNVMFRPTDPFALMSSAHDGAVRLWQRDGEQLAELSGHIGPIVDIEFSPDGQTAVSAGRDRTVRVWAAHWRQWMSIGCKRLQYHVRYRHPEKSGDGKTVKRAELARRTCEKFGMVDQ